MSISKTIDPLSLAVLHDLGILEKPEKRDMSGEVTDQRGREDSEWKLKEMEEN